jgi:hypothetical protein
MRRALFIIVIATAHFVLSIGLVLSAMGATMSRFDDGGPPDLRERIVSSVVHVLLFPLVQPVGRYLFRIVPDGPPWEHMVFAANSLLWATALVALVGRLSQRRGGIVPVEQIPSS